MAVAQHGLTGRGLLTETTSSQGHAGLGWARRSNLDVPVVGGRAAAGSCSARRSKVNVSVVGGRAACRVQQPAGSCNTRPSKIDV